MSMQEVLIKEKFAIIEDGKPKYLVEEISLNEISEKLKDALDFDAELHFLSSPYGPNWSFKPLYDLVLRSDDATLVWIPWFVSLSGSSIYGEEPRDADIIIRAPEKLAPDSALHLKLIRYGWENDTATFDLVLIPAESNIIWIKDTVEKMFSKAEIFRSGNQKLEREALQSKEKDEVKPDRMIIPAKPELSPVHAYRSGEVFDVDVLIEEIRRYAKNRGKDFVDVILQMKVDGARHLVFKKGKKIKIYSEDGSLNTERFPDLVEFLKGVPHDLVLDCEIELFQGKEHQPREILSGAIHSKKPLEPNQHFVYNFFDCIYLDEDIHNLPYIERLKRVQDAEIFQHSEDVERWKTDINFLKSYRATNPEGVRKVCLKLLGVRDSEGVMVKPADSIYPLNGRAPWWKFKKYAEVHALVYDKKQTKKGDYNLYVGVLYDGTLEIPPDNLIEYNGKKYVPVAVTYNTSVDVPIGAIVTVRFHNVNVYEGRVNLYEPTFVEVLDTVTEPDSLRDLLSIGEEAEILIRKSYWLPLWVDESKEYEFMIHRHFRGKSVSDRTPIHIMYQGQYNIVPIYTLIPAFVKEDYYEPIDCYVWTSKGWSKIKSVSRHYNKDKLVAVHCRSALVEITRDHSIFSDGKPVKGIELKVGDIIDTVNIPQFEHNEVVDEDIARLLGIIIREGQRAEKMVIIGKEHQELIDRLKRKYSIFSLTSDDKIAISGLGIINSCFAGKTVLYKRIPPAVFNWHTDCMKVFLENACVSPKKFRAENFQLAEGLIVLGSIVYGKKFSVSAGKHITIDFNDEYDNKVLTIEPKHDKLPEILQYDDSKFVYDIETENQEFVGGIGLARFHNSSHLDFRAKI